MYWMRHTALLPGKHTPNSYSSVVHTHICHGLALIHDYMNQFVNFRGESFRSDYKRVSEVRAVLGNVPVLAMTATGTPSMLSSIGEVLGIPDFKIVAEVPNR